MRRAAIAALGVVSVVLAFNFAGGLAADLYGTIAEEQRGLGGFTLTGVSAATRAVDLQGYRPGFHTDLAWMFGQRGEPGRMRKQYRMALRWSPANAYLWLEYAQALARNYQFDPEYTLALRKMTALGPNARPVRIAAARMGSRHWNQGGEADRLMWAQNMSYALTAAPYELLWTVLRERREAAFCGFVGSELGLSRWCFGVSAGRRLCDTLQPGAKGYAADQCERLGFLQPTGESDAAGSH
jgi:hypothetical protein